MPSESELKTISVLNNFFVSSIDPGWFSRDSINETTTIIALMIKNTTPILSRKGNWGKMYFNNAERGILTAEAIRTELEVARFQNNP